MPSEWKKKAVPMAFFTLIFLYQFKLGEPMIRHTVLALCILVFGLTAATAQTFFTISPSSVHELGNKFRRVQSSAFDVMQGLEKSTLPNNNLLFSCFRDINAQAKRYADGASTAALFLHLRSQLEHPADKYKVLDVFKLYASLQLASLRSDRTYMNQLSTVCNNASFATKSSELVKLEDELETIYELGSRH